MSTAKASHSHHYDSAEHEYESSKLGVWVFLMTEILMFGGLFVGYFIFHNKYPEMFAEGATHLDWKMGAINTLVLLGSSYTIAAAIFHAQTGNSKACARNLLITFICGAVFMGIKYMEYSHKIHEGLLPGGLFSYAEASQDLGLYFSFYFCMTGLHGSHVLVGMGLIFWLFLRARKGEFSQKFYTPVEGVGLFWHLVDLIWIFLFPLLYLVG